MSGEMCNFTWNIPSDCSNRFVFIGVSRVPCDSAHFVKTLNFGPFGFTAFAHS